MRWLYRDRTWRAEGHRSRSMCLASILIDYPRTSKTSHAYSVQRCLSLVMLALQWIARRQVLIAGRDCKAGFQKARIETSGLAQSSNDLVGFRPFSTACWRRFWLMSAKRSHHAYAGEHRRPGSAGSIDTAQTAVVERVPCQLCIWQRVGCSPNRP